LAERDWGAALYTYDKRVVWLLLLLVVHIVVVILKVHFSDFSGEVLSVCNFKNFISG
jgi:hypothetical protein